MRLDYEDSFRHAPRIVIVSFLSIFIIFGIRFSFSVFFAEFRLGGRLEQRGIRRNLQPEYALRRRDRATVRPGDRPLWSAPRICFGRLFDGSRSRVEQSGDFADRLAASVWRH